MQNELLAIQVDSMEKHIRQVESLYQSIRSIKHDMTNHILTLERLYAGNNLEEAADYGKELKSVLSYHRNNAYMIEISNSFTGNLRWDEERGLPATSKEKTEGHGYGLFNIRMVARKYSGDIVIALKDDEFRLSIMLMME